jgi:hypothetical protein
MTMMDAWSEAIGYTPDDTDSQLLAAIVENIRSAVFEAGFVSRGRITSGLKEAYRPFDLDEIMIREKTDAAIDLMLLSGDLEEYTTSAGRGYAGTPPRLINWAGDHVTLLGTSSLGTGIVRQFSAETAPDDGVTIALDDELGRPEWRNALVELGGADAPGSDARALFAFSQALAASGERYSLDEPNAVAVVSGRSEFFGRSDPAPSGRWSRVEADGFYPAAIRTGYTIKNVVLHVGGMQTTLWQPSTRDIWRWIVVGQTLAQGDPLLRYDPTSGVLDFLTPPPRQAERAALITGEKLKPWSWRMDLRAYAVIAKLMGSPR